MNLDLGGNLSSSIYYTLRQAITAVELPPGQFISEKETAARLGLSKTPVREAFIRLAEDGLVTIIPKSGTYVSCIDPAKAMESLLVWEVLESSTAALAAERFTLTNVEALRSILAQQYEFVRSGKVDDFIASSKTLHGELYAIADIPELTESIAPVRGELDRILRLFPDEAPRLEETYSDHCDVVNAVARQDSHAAHDAMVIHARRFVAMIERLQYDPSLQERLAVINRRKIPKRPKKHHQSAAV